MDIKKKIVGFTKTIGKYIKKGGIKIGRGAKKAATKTKSALTSPKFKKSIKGFAKTTGKYTLKGIGKGLEWATRGTFKIANALVKNPTAQKILTGGVMLGAGVLVPPVGAVVVGGVGLKYIIDNSLRGKKTSVIRRNC